MGETKLYTLSSVHEESSNGDHRAMRQKVTGDSLFTSFYKLIFARYFPVLSLLPTFIHQLVEYVTRNTSTKLRLHFHF